MRNFWPVSISFCSLPHRSSRAPLLHPHTYDGASRLFLHDRKSPQPSGATTTTSPFLTSPNRGQLLTDIPIADPFAEADEDTGETKQTQNYIHIRIQREYLVLSLRDAPSDARSPSHVRALSTDDGVSLEPCCHPAILTDESQSAMVVKP